MPQTPTRDAVTNDAGRAGLFVFGASGLIGSALATTSSGEVRSLPWAEASGLSGTALRDAVLSRTEGLARVDVVFACGVTDPSAPRELLDASNVAFPRRVIEALLPDPRFRFVTLGSFHEAFPRLCAPNAYLGTKVEVGGVVQELARGEGRGRVLHVRLHTVFGPSLKPHMFLGQAFEAIRHRRPFRMSSGEQLREYQSSTDVARSLQALLLRPFEPSGLQVVTYGAPLKLRTLAEGLFAAFDAMPLLHVAALARSPHEVVDAAFEPSPEWLRPADPAPLPRIVALFRSRLHAET